MEDIKNNKETNIEDKEDITDEEIAISNLVDDLLFNLNTEDVPVNIFWGNIEEKFEEADISYGCIEINNELSYITIGDIVLKVTSSTYGDDEDVYGSFEIEESSKEEALKDIDRKLDSLHSEIDQFNKYKKSLTSN